MKRFLGAVFTFVLLSVFPVFGKDQPGLKAGRTVELNVMLSRPQDTEFANRELKIALCNRKAALAALGGDTLDFFSKGSMTITLCDQNEGVAILSFFQKIGIEAQSHGPAPVGLTTKIGQNNPIHGYSLEVTPTVDFQRSPDGLVNLDFSIDQWDQVGVNKAEKPIIKHSKFYTSGSMSGNQSILCIRDGVIFFMQAKILD